MRAIDLRDITFRYRGTDVDALAGVDLHADEGERVAVIGLTGAGKSSLQKCVNRLVPSSFKGEFSGEARLFGEDLAGKRPAELAHLVGMVFQDFESQLFSTTAELDVAFGPENLGLDGDEIRARVTDALIAVGMESLRRRDPAALSGGQKQRLAIASVLSLRPRALCLDEPTTDLDPEGRREIATLLATLCESGLTVVLAEHEIELLRCADRVVGLRQGKKIFDDRAEVALGAADLLESLGVRPPDATRVLQAAGVSTLVHGVEEAARVLADAGVGFGPDKSSELAAADEAARAGEGGELIRVDSLSHRYPNGVLALDGVSASIRAGEMVAVLGRNGSGKTTLTKHLNGLLAPSDGAALVDGQDTRELDAAALGRRVGFVFQDPDHQIFAGRVYDEVAFAPTNFGFSAAEIKDRVEQSLALVGLADRADRDPFLLTKGERQRVALASVLAADPEVVILDEPTTGLDYPAQRAVMELLAGLNREGRTVIMVTHSLWVAAEYARRVIVMNDATLVGDGPTREILAQGELLERAGLAVPEGMALGLALGAPFLSADEIIAAMAKERR